MPFAIPVLWLIRAQDIGHLSWVQPPSLLEFYHLGVFLAADGGKAVGAVLLALDLVLDRFFLATLKAVWRGARAAICSGGVTPWWQALFSRRSLSCGRVSIVRPAFYHRFLIICLPRG